MDLAKNIGFFFILPIALGFVTWLLDRAGIALPNWLISIIGCAVFAAIAIGLFYPLQRLLNRWPFAGDGVVSRERMFAAVLLSALAALACGWWIFGRGSATILTIKTDLRLQFYGDTRTPTEIYSENINGWYTLWGPYEKATLRDASGKVLSETEYPKRWDIFVIFEKPTRYKQLVVSFSGPSFPQHEVKVQTDRFAIVDVVADIPAGALEIYAQP
jgi:hypothetical protein